MLIVFRFSDGTDFREQGLKELLRRKGIPATVSLLIVDKTTIKMSCQVILLVCEVFLKERP